MELQYAFLLLLFGLQRIIILKSAMPKMIALLIILMELLRKMLGILLYWDFIAKLKLLLQLSMDMS